MSNKPKFRPEVTRVKLNPEQAVLACNCFDAGFKTVLKRPDTLISTVYQPVGFPFPGIDTPLYVAGTNVCSMKRAQPARYDGRHHVIHVEQFTGVS